VPIAMVGLLVVLGRPLLGGILLTVAAWVKVWPAVFVGAALVLVRERLSLVIAGAGVSVVVMLTALLLGAGANVLSFITQQTGRGLQIEAVMATAWMWDAALGPGRSRVYYDTGILTFQVQGAGVEIVAAVATPLVALVALGILGLGLLAHRRGRSAAEVLPPLALALTVALIVVNKVGSPQFATWLAVPIVFGLVSAAAGVSGSFRVPAVLGLVIAGLTQAIYPYLYHELLGTPDAVMVLILTVRNALYVALLAWAVVALVRLARRAPVAVDREPVVA
jgi:hypothetical protein